MWMCGSKILTSQPLRNLSFIYCINNRSEAQPHVEDPARPLLRGEPGLEVRQQRPGLVADPDEAGRGRREVRAHGALRIVIHDAAPSAHPEQRTLELDGKVVLEIDVERPRGAIRAEDVVALETDGEQPADG